MYKVLAKSIREYKKASVMTPILVSIEVVMECIIPFVIAQLVNEIKAGCSLGTIALYGLALVLMAAVYAVVSGMIRRQLTEGKEA